MRAAPTRAEAKLWIWLRDRRFDRLKFRRQVPIGNYIADFYCVELRLAIELDGSQHRSAEISEYNGERTRFMESLGIYVQRIPNELLMRDLRIVGDIIRAAIRLRLLHPS